MNELMKGVEILSVENISYLANKAMLFSIIGTIFIVCGIILGLFLLLESDNPLLFALIPIGIMLIIMANSFDKIEYIQYKVLIDENVPLLEFNQQYEITDIDGKIYTIKEIKTE